MSRAGALTVAFTSALRAAGLDVPLDSSILFTRAAAAVGVSDPDALYWAGRATLTRSREDISVYDRVFAAFWGAARPALQSTGGRERASIALDAGAESNDGEQEGSTPEVLQALTYSAAEVLRERDFSDYTEEDWKLAAAMLSRLRLSAEVRPSRRRRPSPRGRGRPDVRRTVSLAARTAGEPVRLRWSQRGSRPRRLAILLDISGSMEPYGHALLLFVHAAAHSRRRGQSEVFSMGTRLTRLTRELWQNDPDAALRGIAMTAEDWWGGTRIGGGLREFNDRWGIRGLARGAVVVIVSDGWDRGDPSEVSEEMARLRRVASRIIWANPLKASPGYAPLARGMAAALPFVDQFVEGHSIGAMERLAEAIADPVVGRRSPVEHPTRRQVEPSPALSPGFVEGR